MASFEVNKGVSLGLSSMAKFRNSLEKLPNGGWRLDAGDSGKSVAEVSSSPRNRHRQLAGREREVSACPKSSVTKDGAMRYLCLFRDPL